MQIPLFLSSLFGLSSAPAPSGPAINPPKVLTSKQRRLRKSRLKMAKASRKRNWK